MPLVIGSMLKGLVYIFFLRNVSDAMKGSILDICQFVVALGIGKYLGSIYCQGKVKRAGYKSLVDKMVTKLAGWKSVVTQWLGGSLSQNLFWERWICILCSTHKSQKWSAKTLKKCKGILFCAVQQSIGKSVL